MDKITVNIEIKYGNDFQKELITKSLENALTIWKVFYSAKHKLNDIKFKIKLCTNK